MKNIKIENLKYREYKYYKIIYKYNIIKKCLKENNFILFFYYNFLNPKQRIELQKKIEKNNLKILIIKKKSNLNSLMNKKFKFLNNLLNNNILIIYDKNNEIVDKKIIKELLNIKNITLAGALWDKKLYRPSIIKYYSNINDNIKVNLIFNIKNNLNKLKQTLSNLNKN